MSLSEYRQGERNRAEIHPLRGSPSQFILTDTTQKRLATNSVSPPHYNQPNYNNTS